MKRRHLLLGGVAAAGALVVGWGALPARQRLLTAEPLAPVDGRFALNGWVRIGTDDSVTVLIAQAEMGQGASTGLAMLLAEELDADWSKVRVAQAGIDRIYNNQAAILDGLPFQPDDPGWMRRVSRHVVAKIVREVPGLQLTGGSSSIADQWEPLREAGASARAMLVAAAAARWQVPPEACTTEAGVVRHASGRQARYGELVEDAARLPVPGTVALKPVDRQRLIGQPLARLDGPAKQHGASIFAIDARPAGLLHARLILCPTVGGRVARHEAGVALGQTGVRQVVVLEPVPAGLSGVGATSGGVAVIAERPFQAQKALESLVIEWEAGAAAGLTTAGLLADLGQALDRSTGHAKLERGDPAAALAAAARTVDAQYQVPYLAHAAMEPMNCTIEFKDGAATVWAATQVPALARAAVARELGISADQITLHVPALGGGFGRRFYADVIIQTARLAKAAEGRPVQLVWSREQDMTHDFYRPAFMARCSAGLDADGRLLAWRMTTAGSSLGMPDLIAATGDGSANTAYAFPTARVAHVTVESPMPMGIWRSVNHSQNAFFVESFLDEVAHAGGVDPLAMRRSLLAHDRRHLRVLERIEALAGWGHPSALPTPEVRGRGLALHRSFGSIAAQVAEVSLTPERTIRVHRVFCVIDCGRVVNPNLVRQQVESAIVFGLSAALSGEIDVVDGQVQQTNFNTYTPLRMAECPEIIVDILGDEPEPDGVGEVGTPPIAPAVANAVFALTGQRLRSLPLRLTPPAGSPS